MNLADRYIPVEELLKVQIPPVSQIITRGNKVRVQNTLWEVVSTNDKNGTASIRLAGVFPAKVETVEGN